MTPQLLDEASKVISNPQVLINVVSKRVRQLAQGHRPLVEVGARIDFADIALREIAEGKLNWEAMSEQPEDTTFPGGDSDVAGTIEPASV